MVLGPSYAATPISTASPSSLQWQRASLASRERSAGVLTVHVLTVHDHSPQFSMQLRECGLHLPNPKRLCVRPAPSFPPTPALVRTRLSLQRMQASVSPCSHTYMYPGFHLPPPPPLSLCSNHVCKATHAFCLTLPHYDFVPP